MKTITGINNVIGMYVTDSEELYNTTTLRVYTPDIYKGYLPLFGLININHTAELRFSDTVNKSKEIVSYDRTLSSKSLDPSVVRSKRIDITQNDVYMGPLRVVLNFSNRDISVSDDSEFRKTFCRLDQDKFVEYAGKVVVFTLHTLNTPSQIYDLTGNGNYFDTLKNKLSNRNNVKIKETVKAYDFASAHWGLFNKQINGLIANSIKIISIQIINEEEFIHEPCFVTNLDWVISTESVFNMQDNPSAIISNTGIKEIRDVFPNNSFMCYIVDNEDNLGDRYINVAGHVKKITKIKNKAMPNGLYFADKGSSDPTGEMFCKLEDIDKNEYVYKSIEEANEGANVRKRYQDEIETARARIESLRIESSSDLIRIKTDHEREIAHIKAELEREKAKTQHEQITADREKSKYEIEGIERKRNLEDVKTKNEMERDAYKTAMEAFSHDLSQRSLYNKYDYESGKYKRDSTIETLKTAAAVLGIVSTCALLWTKIKN